MEQKIKKISLVPGATVHQSVVNSDFMVRLDLTNDDYILLDPLELFSDIKDAMEVKNG